MAVLTAGRRGVACTPRRPVHERLADWMDRPHPAWREFGENFAVSAACWALPVAIVVVAITTRGAA